MNGVGIGPEWTCIDRTLPSRSTATSVVCHWEPHKKLEKEEWELKVENVTTSQSTQHRGVNAFIFVNSQWKYKRHACSTLADARSLTHTPRWTLFRKQTPSKSNARRVGKQNKTSGVLCLVMLCLLSLSIEQRVNPSLVKMMTENEMERTKETYEIWS